MTTPEQHAHDEQPRDPQDEAAALALAVILAAAAAAAAAALAAGAAGVVGTAAQVVGAVTTDRGRTRVVAPGRRDPRGEAVDVLTGAGVSDAAARAVTEAFLRMPLPGPRRPGSVAAGQAEEAPLWRGRFLVAAGHRIDTVVAEARRAAVAAGEDAEQAARAAAARQLRRERQHAAQHLEAQQARMDNADALDDAVARHGDVLTWRAVLDTNTTLECRRAHGHLFSVARPPGIGLPGTGPHAQCRCEPRPPGAVLCPDRLTVDQALAASHLHPEVIL